MSDTSLHDVLASSGDVVETFRNMDLEASIWDYPDKPYDFPAEFTHWIREQRAWREQCALIDQSYHMSHLSVEGPEAVDLLERLAVNSFADWRAGDPPMAKQFVAVNPDGYLIGDCMLFWLEGDSYLMVGEEPTHNWVKYHAETGDEDADAEYIYNPLGPRDPAYFRFEVAGPNAMDLMADVVDGDLPEIHFFEMAEFSVQGADAYARGHQMTSERGIEFFGDYEHHDEVLDRLFEVGQQYGLHQVGNKAYVTTGPELAWIPIPVPAVYEHPDLQDYREWLPAQTLEANFALGGSYVAEAISDYYATLGGMGYEHIVDFDHEFVGKAALQERWEDAGEQKVTFIIDDEDVMKVNNSLFREGDTYQFMDIPDVPYRGSISRYDAVLKDGENVGISKHPSYNYNEREVASLGWIDDEYAEPGTRVTIMWGDRDTEKTQIEPHVQTDLQATVAPAPYMKTDRQDM